MFICEKVEMYRMFQVARQVCKPMREPPCSTVGTVLEKWQFPREMFAICEAKREQPRQRGPYQRQDV